MLSQNESSQLFQTCSLPLATPHTSPFVSHPSLANPKKHPVCCWSEAINVSLCQLTSIWHISTGSWPHSMFTVSLLSQPFDYESLQKQLTQVKLWLNWKQWNENFFLILSVFRVLTCAYFYFTCTIIIFSQDSWIYYQVCVFEMSEWPTSIDS